MILTHTQKGSFVAKLTAIAAKPQLYLSAATYWGFCSYIEGYDCAYNGELIGKFKEWGETQNIPANLAWSAGFLYTVFPDQDPIRRVDQSEEDAKLAMVELAQVFKTILLEGANK